MSTSTSRRFVKQLRHQENINQIFMISAKQLRPNRNGNLYLQAELSDRSGSIETRLWNASEQDYRNIENGDYVVVEGATQLFQGNLQLIANSIRRAELTEVQEEDFLTLPGTAIDQMAMRLAEILRGVKQPHLRTLAECFLMDDAFMRKFCKAPAGVKNHHAYQGGLLEHVLGLCELVLRVADLYPEVDSEMLLMGAVLHDMGKIDELTYERDLAYSDAGQLLGHILIAISILDVKVREADRLSGEPFPEAALLELKHMIASHHGQYEYGSPKLPMTLEAVALHHLDNLDAKLHSFHQLLRDDPNVDSPWTLYHANLGRKLYKRIGEV
ncbi:MAG: OB-fold nucleic acid binding domain-containing protein [Pirellulales bacterium]